MVVSLILPLLSIQQSVPYGWVCGGTRPLILADQPLSARADSLRFWRQIAVAKEFFFDMLAQDET